LITKVGLISTITTAQAQLASCNYRGVLSDPISSGRLQNSTRGMAAKGNCRLSTTWLSRGAGRARRGASTVVSLAEHCQQIRWASRVELAALRY
jgi:hypothetical protein